MGYGILLDTCIGHNARTKRDEMRRVFPLITRLTSCKGRASRREFWSALLIYLVACFIFFIICFSYFREPMPTLLVGALFLLIFTPVVCLSTFIRRLHDLDKSGHYLWIPAAAAFAAAFAVTKEALASFLVLFPIMVYLGYSPGTSGPNRFDGNANNKKYSFLYLLYFLYFFCFLILGSAAVHEMTDIPASKKSHFYRLCPRKRDGPCLIWGARIWTKQIFPQAVELFLKACDGGTPRAAARWSTCTG
ncbi:MAG: DUF805 domain-containing protein [Candidatus Accumulibacter sp.]|nr:DUF805 domain-containing protein [Accumulibacter sp.]